MPFLNQISRPARIALLLLPLLYAAFALHLGQDANWDFKNYHWYNGYALLAGRFGYDLLPSQTPFFYNPILDAVTYGALHAVPGWAAAVLLALLQALNGWLLFALTCRLLRPDVRGRDWYALGAAVLGLCGGGTLAELGTCFYDNIVSLGMLGSLYLCVRGLQKNMDWTWFCVAGLPLGMATGAKLPTAIFCVGLCVALLLIPGTFRQRLSRAIACGCGILLGIALTYGYWGAYLWRVYHNPLFPYFNNIFQSPVTLPTSARDVNFVPNDSWLRLSFPFSWTRNPLLVGEVPFRDLKLPLLYALLPLLGLAALLRRKPVKQTAPDDHRLTRGEGSLLLWTLGIAYLCWLLMFAIYRYAVPLEMLAAPALLVVLDRLLAKPLHAIFGTMSLVISADGLKVADYWRTPGWLKPTLLAAVALLCLGTIQVGDWSRTGFSDRPVTVCWPGLIEQNKDKPTMILMAGFQPYSHVIPSLTANGLGDAQVIRLQSNFASPGEPKGINQTIRDRITAFKGRLLFLIPVYDAGWIGREVLPQFGLKARLDECQTVHPNFAEDLSLCPVDRHLLER